MENKVVTLDEIRDLILTAKLKPEDLFDPDELKPLRDAAKAEGYAEGQFRAAWLEDAEKKEAEKKKALEGPDNKYLDPAQNPWIPKTDE